eukprot:SAG31_NODE_3031_length_4765_cov_2.047364_4_plen_71_part_00
MQRAVTRRDDDGVPSTPRRRAVAPAVCGAPGTSGGARRSCLRLSGMPGAEKIIFVVDLSEEMETAGNNKV